MDQTRCFWLISVGVACLVGCASMPGRKADQVSEGLNFPEGYRGGRTAVPEIAGSLGQLFGDQAFKMCLTKAQAYNADLAVAAARLEEAEFHLRGSQAGLFPALSGQIGGGRDKRFIGGDTEVSGMSRASLDVQWEVDVWGKIRAGATAAESGKDAVAADYEAAKQSIAAQTAQAWFDLLAATQLKSLAEQRLLSFRDTVGLVQRRFENGTADLGELSLAQTDVETARSAIQARIDARDRIARRLSVLTGEYPHGDGVATKWPGLGKGVAVGLPSTLLELRPDIYAAYSRILAADANVKVAHRDLFPQFSLTASGGRQSGALSDLAKSNFSVWSVAANLSGPILDGGARRAELGAANARAKQALANYRSVVLNAFREVEDALGSEFYLAGQEQATNAAFQAACSAEERTLRNYESGLVEILSLLEAKRRRFDTEETLINLKNFRYQNRVTLALALGKAY